MSSPVSLFLTASLAASRAFAAPQDIPPAASFYVPTLPGLVQDEENPLRMFAGHIPSDPDAASLPSTTVYAHTFFLMIKARRRVDKERILFWFNGGPGCSSFDGLLLESGPLRMKDGILQVIEGGWDEYSTIVFVDQPPGTGYSYTSTNRYVHELTEAARQYMEFMRNFYKIFPEYQEVDTYLGGESYAGQYIPYFADSMLEAGLPRTLKGVAIGNGWIDARRQYPAYLEYGLKHGLVEAGSDHYKKTKSETDACIERLKKIKDKEPVKESGCENILAVVAESRNKMVEGNITECVNIYDIQLDDTYPACGSDWPYELANITEYLQRKDVTAALHATGKSTGWIECDSAVHTAMMNQNSESAVALLPRILEKVSVMLFAGDQDLICNYVGIEALISALTWNGETGLGKVQTQSWTVDGTPAGTWVTSRNLTYVKIFNASHMAPYDNPLVTHDMILRFMGVNFSSITDGSARIPSSVGDDVKPVFVPEDQKPTPPPANIGKTPEQDKAMWEAYYNAGSAALVLLLIFLAIGVFFWCRIRSRRRVSQVRLEEESIPLHSSVDDDEGFRQRAGKGKERALGDASEREEMFTVADSDDEDEFKSPVPTR
ncbi:alpha/beta-hydrolase [Thelephora ganbajun]|uniref:Alpha/beta-hydrolase n=1 Tax=Thelephora ganbajun TaxID=370292 RepID=A0ACB6ZQX6_THEGA|nr:alpha/beta-hydrolase [Thelephora ganbajun]